MNLYFFRRKDGQGGQRCRWWWCRDKCRFQVMVFKTILAVAWIAYLKYSSKGFLALGATLAYRNILTDHWNDYLISPPGVWVAVWLTSRWKSASARCRRLWGTHLRIQHFIFSFSRVEHGEEETQLDDSLVVLDKCKWKRQRVHTICTVRILVGIRLWRSSQKKMTVDCLFKCLLWCVCPVRSGMLSRTIFLSHSDAWIYFQTTVTSIWKLPQMVWVESCCLMKDSHIFLLVLELPGVPQKEKSALNAR